MITEKLFNDFKESVYELADKLPQWSSKDYARRKVSAYSSILEELGEVSGLVSKYRVRKHYWKANIKELENLNEIRDKFIDELADTLWVITCSYHSLNIHDDNLCLSRPEGFDLFKELKRALNENSKQITYYNNKELTLETFLFTMIKDATIIINIDSGAILDLLFVALFRDFGRLMYAMNKEYDITIDDLMISNMNKLGKRYDKDGNRTDGK